MMKLGGNWLKRAVMLFVAGACTLAATKASAVTQSQFKASLTGVAVVDDFGIFYTNSALAKVVFSSPQTSLVVPCGKTLLLRMSYDFPSGYGAYLWTLAAGWSAAHGGNPGCNPSGMYSGKGTAYGFITLSNNRWDSTLESVTIQTGAYLTGNDTPTYWNIGTFPVNVQFKGSVAASLALGASSRSFTADAANSKELAVAANVAWTAKSSVSWLALKTASGSGNGKIVYNVAANTGTGTRSGTITVGGGGIVRTFAVTQGGKGSGGGGGGGVATVLSLSTYARTFGCGATDGKELGVTANVSWTAKPSVPWVALKTRSGKGNGKILFSVAANPDTAPRTGKITVTGGGKTVTCTIVQAKKTVVLEASPASREFTCAAAAGKELGVKANVGWTAKSSVSWIKLAKASGNGNGKVAFDVAANPDPAPRTGKITVSGGGKTATCTIRQEEKVPMLEVTPSQRAFGSGAQSGKECKVKANVSWTATPSESWIKLVKAGGNGNGTIVFNVAKNQGAKREAAITVKGGGKTVKCRIVQDAIQRANKKFALCVGVNTFLSGETALKGARNDAVHFADNLANRGGGWNVWRYLNYNAKKKTIRAAMATIAGQTIPGDTFVCFVSSHGGVSGGKYCLSTTDADYWDTEFAADLGKFPSGVKVVVVLDTCHAGGMIRKAKGGAVFPFAERVSGILDSNRGVPASRGTRGFVNKISSSEIGWVTASSAGTSSYEGGYYDTGDWLGGGKTGQETGGTFSAAFTWGWWYGEADAQGDNDRQFDAYEGYVFAAPYCKSQPQIHNPGVLRSVELGSCGRANLQFYTPSGWPAPVFVTTYQTYTSQRTSFTAAGSATPCVRFSWHNESKYKVTATGTAARAYTVRFAISGPESWVANDQRKNLMPYTYARSHYYYGLSGYSGVYAAPSAAGTYTATITLDSGKQVSESNENDNTATVRFTVVGGRGTKTGRPEGLRKGNKTAEAEGTEAGMPAERVAATGTTASPEDDGWVAVTTSDGEDGGTLLDGDEGTGWGPVGEGGGWVVLSYSEPIDVKGVSVKGEGLPEEGLRVLLSEDADDWREATEGRAQYVWVVVPEDAAGATLTEIEVEEE